MVRFLGTDKVYAAVIALMLCCACGKEVANQQPPFAVCTSGMRVMSFNVRHSGSPDEGDLHWDVRKYPCLLAIRDASPDIIGFQETYDDQIDYFERGLPGYESFRIPSHLKQFANSIFYRQSVFELIEGGYRWYSLSDPTVSSPTYPDICNDGARRTFMWVKLRHRVSGRTVWLFDTHLPWNPDPENPNDAARRRCIEAVAAMARSICASDDIVFVVGDMNCAFSTAKGRECLAALEAWMTPSFRGVPAEARDNYRSSNGFSDSAPYLGVESSIDHIFYRNVTPVAYKTVISQKYGVRFVSDHYPIYMDCSFVYSVPVYPAFEGSSSEGFVPDGRIPF